MGATFVVDASVIVDSLAPSPNTRDAERFISGLRWADPIVLMAPDVIFLEAANAFRKMFAQRELSPAGADQAVMALQRMPIAAVPCSSVLEDAWKLSRNVTTYDATYIALAKDLDLPFITGDGRASRAASRIGVKAWHVGDPQLGEILDALEPPSARSD